MTPLSNNNVKRLRKMFENSKTEVLDVEDKILEAANKIFLKFGLEGTSMQQIADEAGMSRTSLHYYFRNKNKLFEYVYHSAEHSLIPKLKEIIDAEIPVIQKLESFVNFYIDLLLDNPLLPNFILFELQRDPKRVIDFLKSKEVNIVKLVLQIDKEVSRGTIRPFSLPDMVANTLGMCVFPFMCKPILMESFFDKDEEAYRKYIQARKKEIIHILTIWINVSDN